VVGEIRQKIWVRIIHSKKNKSNYSRWLKSTYVYWFSEKSDERASIKCVVYDLLLTYK